MERATQALLQADLALAEQVITDHDQIAAMSVRAEEARIRPARAAGPGRRRPPGHRQLDPDRRRRRPDGRACAARRQDRPASPSTARLPEEVNGYFAEMGRVAVELGQRAGGLITRDPEKAARIREEDDAMDDLHRHLFTVLMDREWKHGVAAAVDVTLLGRFYERFADHAVEVARRVIFQVTGRIPDEEASAVTSLTLTTSKERPAETAARAVSCGQPKRPEM